MKPHTGISMHAIRVGGNVGGLIFAIGIIVAVLIGLPIAKWFLLAAILGGCATFLAFRLFRRPQIYFAVTEFPKIKNT